MSPVEREPGVAETSGELVELGKSDTEKSQKHDTETHRNTETHESDTETRRAFADPAALAVWLAPDEMTAKVHEFDGPSWRRISDVAVLSLIQKV